MHVKARRGGARGLCVRSLSAGMGVKATALPKKALCDHRGVRCTRNGETQQTIATGRRSVQLTHVFFSSQSRKRNLLLF